MRHRTALVAFGTAAVAILLLSACAKGGTTAQQTGATAKAFSTRTVPAGAVTVEITPIRIDDRGAAFDVKLDTHAVDLWMDLAATSSLTVGGALWSGASWRGAAPGGHHREGTLSFNPAGPATGKATLAIGGLPAPVVAGWDVPAQ